jgi:predicted kinase
MTDSVQETPRQATIFLVEGPVGAGKSTFGATLGARHRAPRLILDEWMVTLFSPDRPQEGFLEWYLDRKQRCVEQIWNLACDLLDTGSSVVLELGLVARRDRADFYDRVDAAERSLVVYVLDAPRGVRLERVRRRNAERRGRLRMDVSDEVFDLADRMWEPPDDAECVIRDIRWAPWSRGAL